MAETPCYQRIPTNLNLQQFNQFVFPHLSTGRRGPASKLSLCKRFNYILQILYMGCQWKMLPIEKDQHGKAEIHYTNLHRHFRRWERDGSIAQIFTQSVFKLHQDHLLDTSVIHGDGTTTATQSAGWIGLLSVILSAIKVNDINLYSSSLALANAMEVVSGKKWKYTGITIVLGIIGTSLSMMGILERFIHFLILLGVVFPPHCGCYFG